ncbi:hypothetical protein SAICODRAFT_21734 [Saitoella complicata NRRL Y-17804]|uniref:Myb-like domain-containing protein n=1 Tax=Saitoella complicata (strain BCRC 22490 / CBS 7301 / JCM 7358 / NBRC 10748 / NRRL Y-17804) TaxID=698492 RepID=A0A0E9NK70_SAICN|nr:uncharacterized protein SAICODRAFT_21734 [Saitoella complicata NRRL Y-17804]ODQ50243.1 hypothetical protein SAICODRAFT_21734 [Saitoella complicata NRRL Y-17804]GAO50203.1 hypothetical protein G7K_4337-t1 [Saitoella complicata NRRL Y-17804]
MVDTEHSGGSPKLVVTPYELQQQSDLVDSEGLESAENASSKAMPSVKTEVDHTGQKDVGKRTRRGSESSGSSWELPMRPKKRICKKEDDSGAKSTTVPPKLESSSTNKAAKLTSKTTTGYTPAEDMRIVLLKSQGMRWGQIASYLPGRTSDAVRKHHASSLTGRTLESFRSQGSGKTYTKEDDQLISFLRVEKKMGWKEVANIFGKSPDAVRKHYEGMMAKGR